jgi:hypothetical protein
MEQSSTKLWIVLLSVAVACALHVKFLSRCTSKYFASDRRISYSNNFILFLGTCFPFVNFTAVLLSVLIFIFHLYSHDSLTTVAEQSKVQTVFAGSNTGIMGSNPTTGMDVFVPLFCVYVVLRVGSDVAKG